MCVSQVFAIFFFFILFWQIVFAMCEYFYHVRSSTDFYLILFLFSLQCHIFFVTIIATKFSSYIMNRIYSIFAINGKLHISWYSYIYLFFSSFVINWQNRMKRTTNKYRGDIDSIYILSSFQMIFIFIFLFLAKCSVCEKKEKTKNKSKNKENCYRFAYPIRRSYHHYVSVSVTIGSANTHPKLCLETNTVIYLLLFFSVALRIFVAMIKNIGATFILLKLYSQIVTQPLLFWFDFSQTDKLKWQKQKTKIIIIIITV